MKNSIVSIFLILALLVSCQSKTQKDADISIGESTYTVEKVGINKDGTYVVTHVQEIKEQWEWHLSGKGKADMLKNFTITKGVTEGDIAKEYYMLSATSADKTIKAAALLELKNNIFCFETHPDSKVYKLIICESTCNEGCDPIVMQSGGARYLNCSSCADCTKIDIEVK